MQQLVEEAPHGELNLTAMGRGHRRCPGQQPRELGVEDDPRAGAKRGDRRRGHLGGARREEGRDLGGDEVARALERQGVGSAAQLDAQVLEPNPGHPGEPFHLVIDVVGQGEIDVDLARRAADLGPPHEVDAEDNLGRTGAGDDDIGRRQRLGQVGERDGLGADPGGQGRAARVGPVHH